MGTIISIYSVEFLQAEIFGAKKGGLTFPNNLSDLKRERQNRLFFQGLLAIIQTLTTKVKLERQVFRSIE